MNFYKHYIGDFDRDTGHLSLTERGAYLGLLHHIYATERPLPSDLVVIFRIVRATSKTEKAAVKRVLEEFFQPVDGGYSNARAMTELASATRVREVNAVVGKLGGRPRKTTTYETESVPIRFPNQNRSETLSRLQTPESRKEDSPMCVQQTHTREQLDYAEFALVKANYPPNAGRTDWITAEHHIRRHLADGATWQDIHAGVERYGRLVAATNRMVLNPARFF